MRFRLNSEPSRRPPPDKGSKLRRSSVARRAPSQRTCPLRLLLELLDVLGRQRRAVPLDRELVELGGQRERRALAGWVPGAARPGKRTTVPGTPPPRTR